MAARTRLTPFARLFFFLLVFMPLAYFGAAYYNNEDPVAKIKSWFGATTDGTQSATQQKSTTSTSNCADALEALKRENYELRQELLKKSEEVRRLNEGAEGGATGTRQKWGK